MRQPGKWPSARASVVKRITSDPHHLRPDPTDRPIFCPVLWYRRPPMDIIGHSRTRLEHRLWLTSVGLPVTAHQRRLPRADFGQSLTANGTGFGRTGSATMTQGRLAQRLEHPVYTRKVLSSNLRSPTIRNQWRGDVVQLVRTLPCHGRGREFESRRPRHPF